MFEIIIRKQDTLPLIERKIYLDGNPVNLTGYTMTFHVEDTEYTEVINNPATLPGGGDENVVQYQWTNADSALVEGGVYFAYFQGTKSGDKLTFPNNRPLSLMVTDTGSWEYSYSGDPSKRPIDKVRFLVGDKNPSSAVFTDSEIEFLMMENGNNAYFAAADLAEGQAGSYAGIADKTVGPLSISYGTQASRWSTLSDSLRSRGRRHSGGRVISTANPRDPIFTIGMNDNPPSDLPPEMGGIVP